MPQPCIPHRFPQNDTHVQQLLLFSIWMIILQIIEPCGSNIEFISPFCSNNLSNLCGGCRIAMQHTRTQPCLSFASRENSQLQLHRDLRDDTFLPRGFENEFKRSHLKKKIYENAYVSIMNNYADMLCIYIYTRIYNIHISLPCL